MKINYAKKDQNKLFEMEIRDYCKQNLKYSSIRKFTTYGVVLKIPEDKN